MPLPDTKNDSKDPMFVLIYEFHVVSKETIVWTRLMGRFRAQECLLLFSLWHKEWWRGCHHGISELSTSFGRGCTNLWRHGSFAWLCWPLLGENIQFCYLLEIINYKVADGDFSWVPPFWFQTYALQYRLYNNNIQMKVISYVTIFLYLFGNSTNTN